MNLQVRFEPTRGAGESSGDDRRVTRNWRRNLPLGLAGGMLLCSVAALVQGMNFGFAQLSWASLAPLFVLGIGATLFMVHLVQKSLGEQRRSLEREFRDRSEQLLTTERRFVDYGETSKDWFWETDTEDRLVFVSTRMFEDSGIPAEYVLGRKRESLAVDPLSDAEREMWADYRQRIENRLPYENLRYTSRTADGREIVYDSSGKPFYDDDGNFLGYRGTARDATGEFVEERRRQAELELTYNATAVLDDGFYIFDADNRLMMCNPRFREIYAPVADLLEPGTPYERILRTIAERQLVFAGDAEREAWIEMVLADHDEPGTALEERLDNGTRIRVVKQKMTGGYIVGLCTDITQTRQFEEELAEAQRISKIGSYRMDFETNTMLSISPQLAAIYGMSIEEIQALDDRYMIDMIHPDDRQRVSDTYQRTRDSENIEAGDLLFEIEYRLYRADGELRHILERTDVSLINNGRVAELVGTLQDVTETRRFEQELEEGQRIAGVGTFRWDMLHDKALSFSAEVARIYGRPLAEVIALGDAETVDLVVHPEDRQRVLDAYQSAANAGHSYYVEYRLLRPDGEVRDVVERAEANIVRDGKVVEFLGTFQDITEQKRAERELEEAQAIAGVGSYRWDNEHETMLSYSREYLRIHDRSEAEMRALGQSGLTEEIIHPADRDRVNEVFERSSTVDETYEIEYRIQRPSGEYRHVIERCGTSQRRGDEIIEQLGTLQDITERRLVEKELEEAQRIASVGSFRWDVVNDRLISSTPEFDRILNQSASTLTESPQHRSKSGIHPDDLPRVLQAYEASNVSEDMVEIEYRVLRDDGIHYFVERLAPSVWRDGRIVEQIGTLQDITERRRVEQELEAAQRIARVGSARWSPVEGKISYFSPEFARIYGMSIAEMGKSADEDPNLLPLIHPDDRDRVSASFDYADTRDEIYELEYRLRLRNGEIRHVIERGYPVSGSATREFQITLQDVTERRRVDLDKRASDDLLEAAIENVPGGFLMLDENGVIQRFNRRFFDLYPGQQFYINEGLSIEVFRRFGAENGIYADVGDDVEDWLARRREVTGADQVSFIERLSDGRSIQIAVRKLPNGNQVGIHVDVTELENARRLAEQANAAKSDFLASMSHELRTPMHGILSFAELGLKRVETLSQEKLKQYLGNIQISGNRLLYLLNDLLDLSKLEAGKMRLDVASFDLGVLVQTCIDEQALRLRENRLTCKRVGRQVESRCACDRNRILQVITNVLTNAIKFSPEDGEIEIGVEAIGDGFRVSVADQGIGIPVADLDQVFDKFYQSGRSRNHGGGTGLGLAICREIIDLHGGRIWAESNSGGGSRILFELPRQARVHDRG